MYAYIPAGTKNTLFLNGDTKEQCSAFELNAELNLFVHNEFYSNLLSCSFLPSF